MIHLISKLETKARQWYTAKARQSGLTVKCMLSRPWNFTCRMIDRWVLDFFPVANEDRLQTHVNFVHDSLWVPVDSSLFRVVFSWVSLLSCAGTVIYRLSGKPKDFSRISSGYLGSWMDNRSIWELHGDLSEEFRLSGKANFQKGEPNEKEAQ